MKNNRNDKTFPNFSANGKNNILYLNKMGCNFFESDEISKISDLNNYRYYIYDVELFNDIKCNVIEISAGARYKTFNGKLKHIDSFGLWVQTYYRDADGVCWGLSDIDKKLNKRNFNSSITFTKNELLNTINQISKIKYNKIEIIEN